VGAPSTREPAEIVAEICGRISAGESVHAIFRSPGEGYPAVWSTFWRWLQGNDEFERLYNVATEQRAELYAEEIASIADEAPPLVQTQHGEHLDAAFVQWQRNRIDARKWVASRMRPRRWGDKTIISNDPDNPVPPLVVVKPHGESSG
jgi:hypothetical protein